MSTTWPTLNCSSELKPAYLFTFIPEKKGVHIYYAYSTLPTYN